MESSVISALRSFVTVSLLHPILVNFTAALVPVSILSDAAARYYKNSSLREVGWWSILYATILTPLTAISGWLFWMKDDTNSSGMAIHKWLGTAFVVLLAGMFLWRRNTRLHKNWVSTAYLIIGVILLALLAWQGHLGGAQTYSSM